MHLVNVLSIVTCFMSLMEARSIENPGSDENETPTTEANFSDNTFVALIDIVFTDNSKRTCTGSIIHENVVITAAHCFIKEADQDIKPEITTSFVVIGTKKMFDSGYEQYLPIERVITHPRFNGWTADLLLVYTFAGMTSDKPGTIIPLAGEKTSTHVDSNVTVLSWGHMRDVDSQNYWTATEGEKCESSSREDFIKFSGEDVVADDKKAKVTVMIRSKTRHRDPPINKENKFKKESDYFRTKKTEREKIQNKVTSPARSLNKKLISRYLSVEERLSTKKRHLHKHRKTRLNETLQKIAELKKVYDERTTDSSLDAFKQNDSVTERNSESGFKSYYKNWRRQMGSQQNQLTVEIFGFVNVQACKKLVEKAMPARYDISDGNDVVCYATEDHFISDEDSGAPAVRRGQLVAVTVGGATIDGDHVAVGMKMSCYCTWIADNLPNGGSHLNCCKNCCDVKHKEERRGETFSWNTRNRLASRFCLKGGEKPRPKPDQKGLFVLHHPGGHMQGFRTS